MTQPLEIIDYPQAAVLKGVDADGVARSLITDSVGVLRGLDTGGLPNQDASILLKTDADSDPRGIQTDGTWERLQAASARTDDALVVGIAATEVLIWTDAADGYITLKIGDDEADTPEWPLYSVATLNGPNRIKFDVSASNPNKANPTRLYLCYGDSLGAKYVRVLAVGRLEA